VILAAGFAVLTLSAFLPLVWLGVFMAVTIAVSLLSDLLILPALLLLTDRGR
jgi:predicted RND superfamily exporter protein